MKRVIIFLILIFMFQSCASIKRLKNMYQYSQFSGNFSKDEAYILFYFDTENTQKIKWPLTLAINDKNGISIFTQQILGLDKYYKTYLISLKPGSYKIDKIYYYERQTRSNGNYSTVYDAQVNLLIPDKYKNFEAKPGSIIYLGDLYTKPSPNFFYDYQVDFYDNFLSRTNELLEIGSHIKEFTLINNLGL